MPDPAMRHPGSPLVVLPAIPQVLMVTACEAGRMHRSELAARKIDGHGYAEPLETVRTRPALRRKSDGMAADGMVTAGERDVIMTQTAASGGTGPRRR